MPIYLSILKGINVSGKNSIKMSDLKIVYKNIGFENVTTYIQSGNVVFESKPQKNINTLIEENIAETFGFEVPVIIRTKEEIQNIVQENPFLKEKNIEIDKLHVTFLSEIPTKENSSNLPIDNFEPDKFLVKNKEVYVYCPDGYGNTKLNNNYFEKKLKVKATTRNWKTTNKLCDILNTY